MGLCVYHWKQLGRGGREEYIATLQPDLRRLECQKTERVVIGFISKSKQAKSHLQRREGKQEGKTNGTGSKI